MAAAVLGWGWRLLCGRIGCFYEVLSAGKKQTARRGCAAAGLQGGDAFAPGSQPGRRLQPTTLHQGCLPGPPSPSRLSSTRPGRHPPGEAVAHCAPQGSEARSDTPRAGWALQKESSPEPWQCPNPAKNGPGLEEDGPCTARAIAFSGCSHAHAAAPRHGEMSPQGRVLLGRMSTARAWGHHSILPPSLAPPGQALQQDSVTGILGKPLAPAALRKSPESPAYGGSGNSLAPGREGLAGAAGRAARAGLPRSEDGGCGVGTQHAGCLHTHPCTLTFVDLAAPQAPQAAPGAPNALVLLEPATSLLHPASHSRPVPGDLGSPQNRPSLLLSSSLLLIYPPLSVPSEHPSTPLPPSRSPLAPFPFSVSVL